MYTIHSSRNLYARAHPITPTQTVDAEDFHHACPFPVMEILSWIKVLVLLLLLNSFSNEILSRLFCFWRENQTGTVSFPSITNPSFPDSHVGWSEPLLWWWFQWTLSSGASPPFRKWGGGKKGSFSPTTHRTPVFFLRNKGQWERGGQLAFFRGGRTFLHLPSNGALLFLLS